MSAITEMLKNDPTIKTGNPEEIVNQLTDPAKQAEAEKAKKSAEEQARLEAEKLEKEKKEKPENLKILSTFFENDFKSEDEVKTHYNSLKEKATKAEQLQAEIDTAKAEAQKLVDEAEDKFRAKYNLDDNKVRKLLILKEYPDADEKVMDKVITGDFSKTYKEDPIEVLKWKYRFEDPEIYDNDDAAVDAIYEKYGINPEETKENDDGVTVYVNREDGKADGDILIPANKIKLLQKEAKEAIKVFDGIRKKIPLPDKTNLTAEKEKVSTELKEKKDRLTTQWEPTFKNFADKELAKFKVEAEVEEDGKKVNRVLFEFDIPESFRKEAKEVLHKAYLETLVAKGVEYNKEAEQLVLKQLKGKFDELIKAKYFDQIWAARETQLRKEMADEVHKELHNPNPLNTRVAPSKSESDRKKHSDQVDDEVGKRFGVGV